MAFVGFLGMVAHYAQKISVGIALVCMVNHTSIEHQMTAIIVSSSQLDMDCPRLNSGLKIVNRNDQEQKFVLFKFLLPFVFRKVHILGTKISKESSWEDIFGVI